MGFPLFFSSPFFFFVFLFFSPRPTLFSGVFPQSFPTRFFLYFPFLLFGVFSPILLLIPYFPTFFFPSVPPLSFCCSPFPFSTFFSSCIWIVSALFSGFHVDHAHQPLCSKVFFPRWFSLTGNSPILSSFTK